MGKFHHLLVSGGVTISNDSPETGEIEMLRDPADLLITIAVSAIYSASDDLSLGLQAGSKADKAMHITPWFNPVLCRRRHYRDRGILGFVAVNSRLSAPAYQGREYVCGKKETLPIKMLKFFSPEESGKKELLGFPIRNQFQGVQRHNGCQRQHAEQIVFSASVKEYELDEGIFGRDGTIKIKQNERPGVRQDAGVSLRGRTGLVFFSWCHAGLLVKVRRWPETIRYLLRARI